MDQEALVNQNHKHNQKKTLENQRIQSKKEIMNGKKSLTVCTGLKQKYWQQQH